MIAEYIYNVLIVTGCIAGFFLMLAGLYFATKYAAKTAKQAYYPFVREWIIRQKIKRRGVSVDDLSKSDKWSVDYEADRKSSDLAMSTVCIVVIILTIAFMTTALP